MRHVQKNSIALIMGLAFGLLSSPNPRQIIEKSGWGRSKRSKVIETSRRIAHRASPEQQIIATMTNWQRNQWGRAGHPMELDKIKEFANLQRPANITA